MKKFFVLIIFLLFILSFPIKAYALLPLEFPRLRLPADFFGPTSTPTPVPPTATPVPPTETPTTIPPSPTEEPVEEEAEEVEELESVLTSTPTQPVSPTVTPTPTPPPAKTNYWQLSTIVLISAILGAGLFSLLGKKKSKEEKPKS